MNLHGCRGCRSFDIWTFVTAPLGNVKNIFFPYLIGDAGHGLLGIGVGEEKHGIHSKSKSQERNNLESSP